MSGPSHPAPTSVSTPAKSGGWLKGMILGFLGLGGGAAGTYATAIVDQVVKPTKPVANFAVSTDGFTLTCQNQATGESGWWDFGDGTPLEPFSKEQPITHTYTKPGSYTVKLTVRNYLGDENERTVPVDVAAAAQSEPPPSIGAFTVQPVSAAVAPATFKLTADVVNAASCVWDLGDGRVEVTGGGKVERLVTFEKPGTFPISLVAHNGKQGAKQSAAAKVEAPRDGSTMAVLKVTDTGNKVERLTTNESVAVPVPSDKTQPTFAKVVHARPGFTIAEATIGDAPPSAKNLKIEVAPDKRFAKLSGTWVGDLKTTNKAAGGSDAIVRVKFIQERATAQPPSVMVVTGMFVNANGAIRADLPLPTAPAGLNSGKREYALEIRTTGSGKSTTVLQVPQPGKTLNFPWSGKQNGPNWSITYNAKIEGDMLVVTWVQGQ
ncbi:PKD domain protein [Gemmata obscuriglobus]|nr:PKD domain-containing protein [Gemmata obscuriglobus]QEG29690.1 PKD domain protein [Gemmata obscuriglobus]VTS09007.1 Cell surface protein OS=Methanosarcina acetivorans (strain ATCC 35395 / DSM 2834 / JCM 12185 / C2A) GN=MA_3700 PE=4 SV=1: PKD: PKD [Gemmata obscuriglobus UQM 2246]